TLESAVSRHTSLTLTNRSIVALPVFVNYSPPHCAAIYWILAARRLDVVMPHPERGDNSCAGRKQQSFPRFETRLELREEFNVRSAHGGGFQFIQYEEGHNRTETEYNSYMK